MKTAKNISLDTKLYYPEMDEIKIVYPEKIEKKQDGENTIIVIKTGYRSISGLICETVLIDEYKRLYFISLKDAQNEQSNKRKEYIKALNEKMILAQKEYTNAIERYFNKPLSNPNNG